jgi:ABC-type Fe3+-hydroxamate transport system substrate-binding protein
MQRIPKMQALAVLALAVLLVFSAPAFASEIKGTLTSVSPDDFVFTLKDNQGTEQTFRLRVDGKVMLNGQEQSLGELRRGDPVIVTFDFDDKDMVASRIRCNRD